MTAATLGALTDDDAFDEYLPIGLQAKSAIHFTPTAVARYIAPLLAPTPGMSVLDVGAGPGKFCLVAAAEVPQARFVGVEFRKHLFRIASHLARELGLPNVQFVHANAFDLDWSAYDAFYFYNPFAEQLLEDGFVLDHSITLGPMNFLSYIMAVRQRLGQARIGTRVVTYHGFGGPPPDGYELSLGEETIGAADVELWIKTHSIPPEVPGP
jgi:SAM-dependent methyltransferase